MRFLAIVAMTLACGWAPAASAEVVSASPSAFVLHTELETTASPDQLWTALPRIGRWWNSAHTYSGDSGRMRLDPRAGGCFCENWGRGQSVEHGRVILVMEHEGVRTLRLNSALGPLQEMGVTGVLTFTVAPHASGAKLTLDYRVSGDPSLGLDALAPLVQGVLNEQTSRLERYAREGRAD